MLKIRDAVFDCRHPASLARFWAAALDQYEVAPYDDTECVVPQGSVVLPGVFQGR
jgi:hypothetical protein